jgi:hypothetical protein
LLDNLFQILPDASLVSPSVQLLVKNSVIGDRIIMSAVVLVALAVLWFPIISDENQARASEPSGANLQAQGDGLMKNVEDMVAHGGMGDAKAIVHHCGEATRFAQAIIKQLPLSGAHGTDAATSLNEVIRQCNRVSDIGIHADPGQLLNPATKARAAAQESLKLLGLTKANKG